MENWFASQPSLSPKGKSSYKWCGNQDSNFGTNFFFGPALGSRQVTRYSDDMFRFLGVAHFFLFRSPEIVKKFEFRAVRDCEIRRKIRIFLDCSDLSGKFFRVRPNSGKFRSAK